MNKGKFIFYSKAMRCGMAFLLMALVSCVTSSEANDPSSKKMEIFVTTTVPNYRIPAIGCTQKGTLIAVADYRYGGADIGYGAVDLHCRISHDNGATWGEELELTHGNHNMECKPDNDAAYGDACIVADRTSDRILLWSCAGNIGFPDGKREHHQGMARFYSYDEGVTWSDVEHPDEQLYSLFDQSAIGPIRSMFIGSGKIHQSRYTKVGDYYRLFCSGLVKDKGGHNCNFVFYSDDFGETWNVLGSVDTPAIPNGDEPKVEELPDGSVVCSSRIRGGRSFNIFTFSDSHKAQGTWGVSAISHSENKGVTAQGNSCNGEIIIVPAVRKIDKKKTFVALQSVPFGGGDSTDGRDNVGIFWKDLSDKKDWDTPEHFARDWDGRYPISCLRSAYSTMCMQADGRLAFLYEETIHDVDFSIVYEPLTLESITDGQYRYDRRSRRTVGRD